MTEERFIFSSGAKSRIITFLIVGVVLLGIGIFLISPAGPGHHSDHGHAGNPHEQASTHANPANQHTDADVEHKVQDPSGSGHVEVRKGDQGNAVIESGHGGEGQHDAGGHEGHEVKWWMRIVKDLWLNNVFFTGIAVIGIFFLAFNYIAQAGWGVVIKRVPETFGNYLFVGFPLAVILLAVFGHNLFHWMDPALYETGGPHYDPIIASKSWYLSTFFYWFRTLAYYGLWLGVWWMLRSFSKREDIEGGLENYEKSVFWSALFLLIFGISSSTSAWDWVMSIDPHFFSTMFGWYVLASWLISGLATITLFVIFLRERGYLPYVNESHIHDLGKFMFAFSIFWTYIWFAQFLLIYYANIPEEGIYFIERLKNDTYSPIFFMNLFINFFFPFLILMTRNAKRQTIILKIVAIAILFGHWMDFYIMMTPPILKDQGGLDINFLFLELGMTIIFICVFVYLVLTGLTKAAMTPKHHPMLEESIHHHIY